MRVTMPMISKQYSKNLNSNLSSLNEAGNKTTNFRKFNKASEDPFSAAKAYQLRREYQQNQDYQSNLSLAQSMLETAESSVTTINNIAQEVNSTDILKAITSTMASNDKKIVSTKLRATQEAIVSTMNTQLGSNYLFGGSGAASAPFTLDANGNLLYRGVNVNTGENSAGATSDVNGTKICFGVANTDLFNGYTITIEQGLNLGRGIESINVSGGNIAITLNAEGSNNGELQTALQNQLDNAFTAAGIGTAGMDFSKITVSGNASATVKTSEFVSGNMVKSTISNIVDLDALANEKIYVDLGLGLNVNNNNVQAQSAFNISMPGIAYLGYGTNADGTPKNIYSLLGKIADQLESGGFSMDNVKPYLNAFDDSQQQLLTKITDIGARTDTLEYTQKRLENMEDSLLAKIDKVEYENPVDAIMDYKMQQYTYTAALQIGTNILQPTFLDFMK